MADYLKNFETTAEYNTYINGNNILRPNVSYCEDNNGVYYNPIVPPLPLIITQYEWDYGQGIITDRNGSLIVWDDPNEFGLVESGGLFMWYHINDWNGSIRKVTVTEIDENTTTFNVDGVDYVLYTYTLTPTPELLSD